MGGGASVPGVGSIKNVTAFASAAEEIVAEMKESGTGEMSYEDAFKLLKKYEHAYTNVTTYFPGAEVGTDILAKADAVLIDHGCNGHNTLYAQSVCPDEINHESGDITELFAKHMGEVFHMGGLAGIPFTGRTGFTAFSHHIPDDGNLFVLFAPHIGLSDTGHLGKYTRKGQSKDGTACGAACGALKFCEDCAAQDEVKEGESKDGAARKTIPVPGVNSSDYQMEYIISEINKRLPAIASQPNEDAKQAALAAQMFEIAKDQINHVINFDPTHHQPTLYVLGGVQINMPKPMHDFFQPLMFEVRKPDGTVVDLMETTFGPRKVV